MKLVILDVPNARLLSRFGQRASDGVRLVYWANGSVDRTALRYLSDSAESVVVEDTISGVVERELGRSIALASQSKGSGLARIRDWLRRDPADRSSERKSEGGPVLCFPTNDTIAKMLEQVAEHLDCCVFATPIKWINEGAAAYLQSRGVSFTENHERLLEEVQPSAVVFGNDWSSEEIEVINKARARGIPTVCIQEGCLDWGDSYRRMEWTDFPLVQGPVTLKYLRRPSYFLTGNPRFDEIRLVPYPNNPTVMINCNFTYGIHEDVRDSWLASVVKGCQAVGVEFFVSQHPRDGADLGDLPCRQSCAAVVHDHLADCSILVSRFSTVIYEAALMGRSVVYFNPHGERMATFNEDNTGGIQQVVHESDLVQALKKAIDRSGDEERLREHFARLHCGACDGRAAERCAMTLTAIC